MQYSAPEAQEQVLSTLNRDGTRRRIRPKPAPGRFLTKRRIVAYGLMLAFLAMPYLELAGKPLILLDLANRQFVFFGNVFLATDTLFLLLIGLSIAAVVLLLTALFGRVWCGWACPQTVYMEFLYRPIERLFEGNPAQQRKLDSQSGISWRRLAKNIVFLGVSMFVAHVFLAYFVGIDKLAQWVQRSPAEHPVGFAVMGSVTLLMFADFAWFREQTCIVACPYGRLQSVLLDKQSIIVGYDSNRGEPRGKLKRKLDVVGQIGDCIDCAACVHTCPTGIDIRNGLQMECIGCTQCIDACDSIMDRVGKPRGLIRYTSQDELAGKSRKVLRPRVLIYPAILAIALVTLIVLLTRRAPADVEVLRVAGTPFTVLEDGEVSNPLNIKITNRTGSVRRYHIELTDAAGHTLISPQNDSPVDPQKSLIMSVIVLSPKESFRAGKSAVHLRVVGDDGFTEEISQTLIGPEH